MFAKRYVVILLISSGMLITSCGGESPQSEMTLDQAKVTYAQVRKEIDADAKTLQGDIQQRLDVLQVYIDDMMKEYRMADEERQQLLAPKVEKLRALTSEVRGTLKTYSPSDERISKEQQDQLIDKMQELRATYQDLVTRLGITWH